MVVGVATAVYYIMKIRAGESCAVDKELLVACGIMYSTYLYLFVEFGVKRFILKSGGGKGKEE